MSLYTRILQLQDLDELLQFEAKKLNESPGTPEDRIFQSWNSRARKESLEHYLSLGWSFLVRDTEVENPLSSEGQLLGYMLAQPFLFFEGHTQTLWIEHLSYSTLATRDELCNLAYRLSREKHFQKVLFPQSSGVMNSVASLKPEVWQPAVISIKTTK